MSLFVLKSSEYRKSTKPVSKLVVIKYIDKKTESIIKNVCRVSVQTTVFIPPLKVYIQINNIEIVTVNSNGIPHESNTNFCKTIATKNNRKAAPSTLDTKKKNAPVICEFLPNLSPRYWYIEVKFCL